MSDTDIVDAEFEDSTSAEIEKKPKDTLSRFQQMGPIKDNPFYKLAMEYAADTSKSGLRRVMFPLLVTIGVVIFTGVNWAFNLNDRLREPVKNTVHRMGGIVFLAAWSILTVFIYTTITTPVAATPQIAPVAEVTPGVPAPQGEPQGGAEGN